MSDQLVGFYARVSSDQQAQANTIDSQISALKERIKDDKHVCPNDLQFIPIFGHIHYKNC